MCPLKVVRNRVTHRRPSCLLKVEGGIPRLIREQLDTVRIVESIGLNFLDRVEKAKGYAGVY